MGWYQRRVHGDPTITSNNQSNPTTPHSLLSTPPPKQHQTIKMAFFKSLIIASVAAVAFAAPQGASDKNTEVKVSGQDNSPKCGNGQKIACCNSGEDLIGLNCLSIPILAIPIQQACGSNVAACCQTGDAKGNLINLEANCLAIPL